MSCGNLDPAAILEKTKDTVQDTIGAVAADIISLKENFETQINPSAFKSAMTELQKQFTDIAADPEALYKGGLISYCMPNPFDSQVFTDLANKLEIIMGNLDFEVLEAINGQVNSLLGVLPSIDSKLVAMVKGLNDLTSIAAMLGDRKNLSKEMATKTKNDLEVLKEAADFPGAGSALEEVLGTFQGIGQSKGMRKLLSVIKSLDRWFDEAKAKLTEMTENVKGYVPMPAPISSILKAMKAVQASLDPKAMVDVLSISKDIALNPLKPAYQVKPLTYLDIAIGKSVQVLAFAEKSPFG
eukprot:CAMPEP_0185541360 /NCGR_PEP_ID=MMETSP1381-20130426/1912_1 /TAXON_ID=298111 /ORGANISM="Pavlova sp., Strain CCMP459" /LENGTH=297 /DNA_ID=CAMNT_0028153263 /DNA_START=53 /DNA_END=946 /DNA_ORIENTATION=+